METIANPTRKNVNVEAQAFVAHTRGITVVYKKTFTSPH